MIRRVVTRSHMLHPFLWSERHVQSSSSAPLTLQAGQKVQHTPIQKLAAINHAHHEVPQTSVMPCN